MNCITFQKRYEEEKDALSNKNTKIIDYTKLRLTDDYWYESEGEDKQTDKKLHKKEPSKKLEISDAKEFNKLINKEETSIHRELFKRFFTFQMPNAKSCIS